MDVTRARKPLVAVCLALACLGAAPAAPSYLGIEQLMDRVQEAWKQPGVQPPRNAPGWNTFFDAVRSELRVHAAAQSEDERLRSLDRLYRMSVALQGVTWVPATQVREELRAWLRPRVQLASAERALIDSVRSLSAAAEGKLIENRQGWIRFVHDDLGAALREYERAGTVASRQAALKRVNGALTALQTGNKTHPWNASAALETAVNDLFNRPNLDVKADAATLSPALNKNVVAAGPVFFRGHWSYVTPGTKTGFGLLYSDDGIAFFNSQMMTSVTPIQDFQEQMQQDPRARRVTKLYQFNATTQDYAQLTITAVLRTDGLHLTPSYLHNVDAAISAAPIPGREFGRLAAALMGFGRNKITQKVYQGAIGQMRSGAEEGSLELGTQRTSEAAAERNELLRKYLVGNNTLVYKNLEIRGLSLRSRPEHALVAGTLIWNGAVNQVGADAPQPAKFVGTEPGITVDVHLPSLMTNLTRGLLQSESAEAVKNLMVETRKVPPGASPREGIVVSKNVDFSTFRTAVETSRAAKDPKVLAIRVKKPGRSPDFAADAHGNLVAMVHDFAIEVPAPPQATQGGALAGPPADVYLLSAPQAEFVISFKIEPAQGDLPIHLSGRIEGFDPGPGAKVFAITEDETKAVPLTLFTGAVVLRVFGSKLQGQPIDIPLSEVDLRGVKLTSVSQLDPSGWIRLVLITTPEQPKLGSESPVPPAERVAERP